jgi:hypothetical protein
VTGRARPLVRFLLLGGALFAATRALERPPAPPRPVLVVDAAGLRERFTERTGLAPTASDEAALVAEAVDEELLYRDALARGLDRHDRSIRHRLVEKMRFLAGGMGRSAEDLHREALALGLDRDDPVVRRILVEKVRLLLAATAAEEPAEAELAGHVAAHPERYALPARVRLWQVFVGASPAAAARILGTLRAGPVAPAAAGAHGRPFPLGGRVGPSSAAQLARLFGAAFARAAFALPVGEWAGPVASTYGLHLVWVERREAAAAPDLAGVRSRAREAVRAARRPEGVRRALAELRRRYDVRVTGRLS